jgi:hypothetical protein
MEKSSMEAEESREDRRREGKECDSRIGAGSGVGSGRERRSAARAEMEVVVGEQRWSLWRRW